MSPPAGCLTDTSPRCDRLPGFSWFGSQIQTGIEWAFLRHFTLVAIYAHFFAGPFLADTGPARDVDYVTVWGTLKF